MKWITTKERQKARILICEMCPHFRSNTRTCGKPVIGNFIKDSNGDRIHLCGCFMDAKTNLTFSSCPLKKWEAASQDLKDLKDAEVFIERLLGSNRVSRDEINKAYKIYKDLIGATKKPGNCPPCITGDLKAIQKKINEIKKER